MVGLFGGWQIFQFESVGIHVSDLSEGSDYKIAGLNAHDAVKAKLNVTCLKCVYCFLMLHYSNYVLVIVIVLCALNFPLMMQYFPLMTQYF